jgi:hypothetical protein
MASQEPKVHVTGVVEWVLSGAVALVGFLPFYLAITDDYSWGFAVGLAVLIWTFVAWNLATLPRGSEKPGGQWLIVLSLLGLIAGLAGVLSSETFLGTLLTLAGCVGFIASWRQSSRSQ